MVRCVSAFPRKPRPSKGASRSFRPPPATWSSVATRSGSKRTPGIKSGFKDEEYTRLGVNIAADAAALYEKGELIVKVKEPIAGDLALLRKDHLLFCYLHLAPEPELTKHLLDIGLTGIAFETVELPNGDLPLLAPMSIIAGKIARAGRHAPAAPAEGGKGKLLGGLPSTERGKVVVFGAGKAGGNPPRWPRPAARTSWCSRCARTAWTK